MKPSTLQIVAVGVFVVLAGITGVSAWMGGLDGVPSMGTDPSDGTAGDEATCDPSFQDVASQAGLDYASSEGAETRTAEPDFNGVFVVDYDGDGWSDVLLIGGDEPTLYENTGGQFEATEHLPSETYEGHSINTAAFFDRDGDGRQDLLLLPNNGSPVFFTNEPDGFEVRDVGLGDVTLKHPSAISTADYDGDGRIDVFIGQYGQWSSGLPTGAGEESVSEEDDNGNRNLLLRNTETGFENATAEAGIRGPHWTLATSFVDFTGDGRPDIHVGNDFNNDTLYVNEGDGTFRRTLLDGDTDRNAMSSEVADFDGDGRPDVFVTNIFFSQGGKFMDVMRHTMGDRMDGNNLLINQGNGTFVDRADEYGVRKGGWGWAATADDFDNDGHLDLFHVNQNMRKIPGPFTLSSTPYLVTPMYWTGSDDGFERLDATNIGFEETDGRGVASLDYDHDGDRDLVVTDLDGQYKLYENRVSGCHFLDLRIRNEAGAPALGAEVNVTVDGERRTYFVTDRTDYQSQESRAVHVGLGDVERADRIQVVWRDGTEQTFENVAADQRLVITPSGIEASDSDG